MDNKMAEHAPNPKEAGSHSHNLLGQRLGRKGRDTRARILAATYRLVAEPHDTQLSLSAVANEAAVGLTTLYLYFADMGELLLAALEPVIARAHAVLDRFAHRWPDTTLEEECQHFLEAHHAFWTRHSRILHFRNSFADAGDRRLMLSRRVMSNPAIAMLARQMSAAEGEWADKADYAVVLLTMLERMATITTEEGFSMEAATPDRTTDRFIGDSIRAQARIMALTIHDQRGCPPGQVL